MNRTRRCGGHLVPPLAGQLEIPGDRTSPTHETLRTDRGQPAVDQSTSGRRRLGTASSPGGTDGGQRWRRVSSVLPATGSTFEVTVRRRRISAFELPTRSRTETENGQGITPRKPVPVLTVQPSSPKLPARRQTAAGEHSRPGTAGSLGVESDDRRRATSLGTLGAPRSGHNSRRSSPGTPVGDLLTGLDRPVPLVIDPRLSDVGVKQFYSSLMLNSTTADAPDVLELQDDAVSTWAELWRLTVNGEKPGQIRSVRGVCFVPGDRLAVTEDRNGRVQLLDCRPRRSSNILYPYKHKKGRRRFQPGGICSIPSQFGGTSAWLAVTDVDRVLIFDEDADRVDELNVQSRTGLYGVAVTGRGRLVLTDAGDCPTVGLHDFTSGQLINEFDVNVEFRKPLHVSVNVDYSLTCVSDSERRCVYVFDRDGHMLLNTVTGDGRRGSEPGCKQFIYPAGICCADEGRRLLVVDSVENCVASYDFRTRRLLPVLTAQDHGLRHPSCMAADESTLALVEEFDDVKIDHCQLKLFTRDR